MIPRPRPARRAGAAGGALPLVIGGIAVILLSTAAIARIIGWSPGHGGLLALHDAAPLSPPRETRAGPRCPECGVVVSIQEIESHDTESSPEQESTGSARKPGARSPTTMGYEVMVRMFDGSSRLIPAANREQWRTGERVIVIDGSRPSHP